VNYCKLVKIHSQFDINVTLLVFACHFIFSSAVVGGLRFYRYSIFYLSFFVSYPPSSLNGTRPKPATCPEVSAIWKCMSEIRGIPSPKNRMPKTTFFRRLRPLTTNVTTYIFRMKHDIHNRASALDVATSLQKCHELWSTNGLKLHRSFTYLSILFGPRSIVHALSGINMAPHGESKWNGIVFVYSSDSKPQKDFNLATASRRAALSGNRSLIATFSSQISCQMLSVCVSRC